MKLKVYAIFVTGFLFGVLITAIFEPTVISSEKPIIPIKRLQTDGNTVDTIYIYSKFK